MAFELTVSTKRDPLEVGASDGQAGAPGLMHAKIALNGGCDEAASQAIVTAISDANREGADSIIVEMQDVDAGYEFCLKSIAAGVMSQRSAGVHVQVAVRHEKLYERMAELPDSRDWLLGFKDADVVGARRAIHVDGINKID